MRNLIMVLTIFYSMTLVAVNAPHSSANQVADKTPLDPNLDIEYLEKNAIAPAEQDLVKSPSKHVPRSHPDSQQFLPDLEKRYFDTIKTKASAPKRAIRKRNR